MTFKKAILSFLLILALCLLTACSQPAEPEGASVSAPQSSEAAPPPTEKPEESSEASTPEPTQSPEPTPEPFDPSGKKWEVSDLNRDGGEELFFAGLSYGMSPDEALAALGMGTDAMSRLEEDEFNPDIARLPIDGCELAGYMGTLTLGFDHGKLYQMLFPPDGRMATT